MDDNTFWILILVFLTPFGWLGLFMAGMFLMMLGEAIGKMLQGARGKLK